MKAPFSSWLDGLIPELKKLLSVLEQHYDYVSILSTDTVGMTAAISQHSKQIGNQTMASERGTVIRVCRDGLYSEYAFDLPAFAMNSPQPEDVGAFADRVRGILDEQLAMLREIGVQIYETPVMPDSPLELFVEKDVEQLPEDADLEELVTRLVAISDHAMTLDESMIEAMVNASSTHVSKVFLSKNRDLRQSYVYSEGVVAAVVMRDGMNKFGYDGVSGACGPEIFAGMDALTDKVVKTAVGLLDAQRVTPGTYEVITTPEVTGLIAHEAFGHGVEMDMFVKGRALGAQYIGKRVASDLVTMHEGALCAENVTSYAFDDEGTLAGDVIEIENGILRSGICDALSALRLGVEATGNGKRQNFAHKVYSRMTNTLFDSGTDTLDDMIASVQDGFLLAGVESGMEDPKHWGIQCIIQRGMEIKDGKLTGKVFSPIILTGYVPDLLGNITMASTDRCVYGNGGCGKGYKEWVKVSDGGPYLKTVGRLG